MTAQLWGDHLRRATPDDDAFLYDVFCATWQAEVAAMPNPNLVRHFLRIQYTTQSQKLQQRFPGQERWVVMHDGERVGVLVLHRSPSMLHVVEIALLPEFRSRGIGSTIVRTVMAEAGRQGETVSMRVSRRSVHAPNPTNSLGFRLVAMDDQDSYYEWTAHVSQLT